MFQHILVPLDGSQRAEQAIPVAAQVARASGGSLFFLRVVDTLQELGVYSSLAAIYLQEMLEKERIDAAAYLEEITASPALLGIKTRCAVFSGSAAAMLLHVAQQEDIDLMVLCSHGYTGFKRWALGSVAQKVARHSSLPLLLLREQNVALQSRLGHPVRAQVALDGSSFAEASLLPAGHLVAALSAPEKGALHLIHVVKRPTLEEERAYREAGIDLNAGEEARKKAASYMQEMRERCLSTIPDVQVTWSIEEAEDIASAILSLAVDEKSPSKREAADLIVLTTHGRSGLQRWRLGSVAERVLQASTLPLFIVHPQRAAS